MANELVLDRLESLFKEELWGRIEPKDIGISKFKIIDDIFNSVVHDNSIDDTLKLCEQHLDEYPESVISTYLIGIIGYHTDNIEYSRYLRKLIDIFIDNHKWAVVELLTEKILEYGENSVALRALAVSLERLGRNKEAIPVLESLLKIDRFDADLAKKLAFAIIDEDPDKSIHYMKLSIEGFIKNKNYDEITALWNKLVSVSWEDISFFERIERLLVEAKEHELAASLLKILLSKHRDEDNPEQSIEILKKILIYRPQDTQARRDLIKFYSVKHENHSQFEQFLKLSGLNNFKKPVRFAIQDFEKNIFFDSDNYVFHISWKLGKIIDISNEGVVINFKEKPEHRMSIPMAIQSLTPISKDHLYVLEFEDENVLKELFKEDFMQFFEILIKSYGGEIVLADIKRELMPKHVSEKAWAKWWTKARTQIKKNAHYGVSEKKKDLFFMRDKPVTFADELLGNFTHTESFSDRLDIAIEFINNIDKEEGASVSQYLTDYFVGQIKGDSITRQILSYFIINDLKNYDDSSKLKLDQIREKVIGFIKQNDELPWISMKISSYDYKKEFVNLIVENREDWPQILSEILYETPVRIHKYIINTLIQSHDYRIINSFIDRMITGAKQYPDIFLWASKNILTAAWEYDWLDYSREGLVVAYFRLLSELKKIEVEGNRLKNQSIDILFNNEADVLRELVSWLDEKILRRIYDVFSNVSFVEESESEKFLDQIKEKYPDFLKKEGGAEDEIDSDFEELIVSPEGYERMQNELERLVNDELVMVSKELAKVSEASSDVRENFEYNALMEKQSIIELSISKLDNEIKKVEVIDIDSIKTDSVKIGTKVVVEDGDTNSLVDYTILGPWDADFEKKILSYRSPIARSLLGAHIDEVVELKMADGNKKYTIKSIVQYNQ